MLSPVLEELASERADIKVCKVNVDEEPSLAGEFGVMSIPTLVSFRNGEMTNRVVGAIPKKQIENMF